jgi:hypothetical protein
MIHNRINGSGDHWGVSYTGYIEEMPLDFEPKVLVQLQEKGEQVRVGMSPEEAEYMAADLLKFAAKVREGIKNRDAQVE